VRAAQFGCANKCQIRPLKKNYPDPSELDLWLIAVLQDLSKRIEAEMAAYKLYAVVPLILSFVDDLTNWYVRRRHRRFWRSDNDSDKNFAYSTLYKALVDFSKILAPFLPFLSEEIYQILSREANPSAPVSVHFTDYPAFDAELANERFEELHFAHDDSELAKISAKPSFAGIKAKGVEYAKNMKNISAAIAGLDAVKIRDMQGGGLLSVCGLDVDYSCLMIVREVAEGLAVEADENYTAALDLKLTPELFGFAVCH